MSCDLGNVYREYLAVPASGRDELLGGWVTSLRNFSAPGSLADVRQMLLPMIRARGESSIAKTRSNAGDATMVERPFSEDLVLAIVVDRPDLVTRIHDVELRRWDVDEEAVYGMALHNLRLRSADAWKKVARNVYASDWHDAFDVTRVVFTDLLRRVPIEGEPVVMTPNRDCLLLTSARDPEGLSEMVEVAIGQYDDRPHALSIQPLVLREDIWRPFDVGGDAMREVRQRLLAARADEYQQQAKAFEDQDAVFFASLMQDIREGDGLGTTAAWPYGVPTLLPKCDTLGVFRSETEMYRVLWSDAESIVDGLDEPEPGLWPPRYRVGVPTDSQFASLKAAGETFKAPS